MKGLTPSYLLSILESSYRKQVSPLSLFIKASLNWNQLTERFGFKGVLYTKVSPRVFVLCRWNEISYLNQQFAEELNSIKLPTFHHTHWIFTSQKLQASRWRLALSVSWEFPGIPRLQLSSRLNEFYFVLVSITQRGRTLLPDNQCSDVLFLKWAKKKTKR